MLRKGERSEHRRRNERQRRNALALGGRRSNRLALSTPPGQASPAGTGSTGKGLWSLHLDQNFYFENFKIFKVLEITRGSARALPRAASEGEGTRVSSGAVSLEGDVICHLLSRQRAVSLAPVSFAVACALYSPRMEKIRCACDVVQKDEDWFSEHSNVASNTPRPRRVHHRWTRPRVSRVSGAAAWCETASKAVRGFVEMLRVRRLSNAEKRSVTVRAKVRCAWANQLSANGRGWEGLKLNGAGRGRGARAPRGPGLERSRVRHPPARASASARAARATAARARAWERRPLMRFPMMMIHHIVEFRHP